MQQQQQLALGCTYVLVLVADWLRTVSLWQRRRQAERPGARRCRGDLCAAQPSSTALPFSYRFTGAHDVVQILRRRTPSSATWVAPCRQ
jgi:hypothetical protein